ncbi:hypothetical protein HK102_010483 [Quaeritorhiza haematococci]|nr:hypothetical protein HK102_010483 [Quaeritorhiza haematococci]
MEALAADKKATTRFDATRDPDELVNENADGLYGDTDGAPQPGDTIPLNANHPAVMSLPVGFEANDARARSRLSEGESDDEWKDAVARMARHFGSWPFARKFKFKLQRLPKEAKLSRTPWPGSYWPTWADSINYRWNGDNNLSPVEKYAKAFGHDAKQLSDAVSQLQGIQSQGGRRTCKRKSDCASLRDGSECAIRRGETEGLCIPRWFGLCHAWAPAAYLEKEPKCEVEYKGVTFNTNDLKALMTSIYDQAGIPTIFGGKRCYEDEPSLDEYGRFKDVSCRDLNPGLFHLVMANMLGRFKHSFIIDKDSASQVWNQPVLGYKVLETVEISREDAMRKFFPDRAAEAYPFNADAKKLVYVRTILDYIVERGEDGPLINNPDIMAEAIQQMDLEYVLELEDEGRIIGGEWVNGSKQEHPDFLWVSTEKASKEVSVVNTITYKNVKMLWRKSRHCGPFWDFVHGIGL